MKKTYFTPEFDLVRLKLADNVCLSNPEGYAGDGNYGGDGQGSEAGEE